VTKVDRRINLVTVHTNLLAKPSTQDTAKRVCIQGSAYLIHRDAPRNDTLGVWVRDNEAVLVTRDGFTGACNWRR
jgi:hypothetical protein